MDRTLKRPTSWSPLILKALKQNNYSGTTSNVHINSATDPAVLFDGYYAPGYHKGNIGSYYYSGGANYTTVINFTPEVTDATVIGHFRGGNGRYFDITYADGSTQSVPAATAGPSIMEETPLTNNSELSVLNFKLVTVRIQNGFLVSRMQMEI